jgi:hypothetical protein
MNKKEFVNGQRKNLKRLVANDCADTDGSQRVLFAVDGGPGRTDQEMLQSLRLLGIFLFPSGPPNTACAADHGHAIWYV